MDTIILHDLAVLLESQGIPSTVHGDDATPVRGTACNSRVVTPQNLFICKGAAFQPKFLIQALDQGATSYLCADSMAATLAEAAPGVPSLQVADGDLRPAMAHTSAAAWGHPDRDLEIVGVTGTKGKTTVTTMIRAIVDAQGAAEGKEPCAFFGTHEIWDGVERVESANTTPEPPDLWRHLARAREAGVERVVMEVSSQALKYDRVLDLRLAVACFLNIGHDHISPIEHPTFEDYLASKLRIFEMADGCVIDKDTDHADEVFGAVEGSDPVDYSMTDPSATVHGTILKTGPAGSTFTVETPSWSREASIPLAGDFNVENALGAIACASLLGIGPDFCVEGLAHCHVPGRMEVIPSKDGVITAIVDYAHNGLSYDRFFETVKAGFPEARIVAFFGVSGGKALDRYHDLPTEASKYADHIILTSDDPGPEDPAELVEKISRYVAPDVPFEKVPDREEACERAFQWALDAKGPVVICALGKGAETTIRVGHEDVPYEPDAPHLRRLMAEHGLA